MKVAIIGDKKNTKSLAMELAIKCNIPIVVSILPCERINRLDNNRCINCGVKVGSECAK